MPLMLSWEIIYSVLVDQGATQPRLGCLSHHATPDSAFNMKAAEMKTTRRPMQVKYTQNCCHVAEGLQRISQEVSSPLASHLPSVAKGSQHCLSAP